MVDLNENILTAKLPVKLIYDVKVPMPDGVKLGGNLYLPDSPGTYPGILTFIPYLKDGWGGIGMLDAYQRHFASRGYAVLQLDFRGVGGSEGVNPFPFNKSERDDGYHAVEWIAEQPWCTGAVGMWGLSYGGITSLAVASKKPPHLRAIAPIHATDDNMDTLFVHRGSRLMYWADPHWGPIMAANNLLPPLRGFDEDGQWLKIWRQRLENNSPWQLAWHGEPPYENYWDDDLIDASNIDVPMLIVGGWQDAYPDNTMRIYNRVRGPRRLFLGPWKHVLPDLSEVEPIGIAAEMDLWWDRWLKDIENGIDKEPPVTIFVQGINKWRHEVDFPISRIKENKLYTSEGRLLSENSNDAGPVFDCYDYDARGGLAFLHYDACNFSVPYPADQIEDDHLSLCYTGPVLEKDMEITGQGYVEIFFSTDVSLEDINLVAKLCDVQPDGRSYLITYENINASRSVTIGECDSRPIHTVKIQLRVTSYCVLKGHRLRISLSGANFPYIWPTPKQYKLQIYRGAPYNTSLTLPVAISNETTLAEPKLQPAGELMPVPLIEVRNSYKTFKGLGIRTAGFEGKRLYVTQVDPQTILHRSQEFEMVVDADHPDRANTSETAIMRLERPVSQIEIRVENTVTLYDLCLDVEITLDGKLFFRRRWEKNW